MAKSAQQRLNEFMDESRETRIAMGQFQEAAYTAYGSHSYAAGFLESKLIEVIMELPKQRRAELREIFKQQAKKMVDTQAA